MLLIQALMARAAAQVEKERQERDANNEDTLNYLTNHLVKPGAVLNMEVRHAKGCKRPSGGKCSCEPELQVKR